jgi:outer membrane protein assembly factor BamB
MRWAAACIGLLAAGAAAYFFFLAEPRGAAPVGPRPSGDAPQAQEVPWPMFRGDQALRGVAAVTLPDKLKLAWRFETKGPVTSPAVIAGGRVFVGSCDGNVYAIDAAKGTKLWSFATKDQVQAAPLYLDGSVYVGGDDSFLYALDAAAGTLKWKYETGDKIIGGANWARSPDGAKTWILVGSYDYTLHCVDAATGAKAWTYSTENYINGAPAIADGKVVVGGCDERLHVVALADGSKILEVEAGAYIAASVPLDDGHAYLGNYLGQVLSVAITSTPTGDRTAWRYEGDGEAFFSAAAITPACVVIGSRDKRLHCIDRKTGAGLWRFAAKDLIDSSPVICGDKVVVGSSDGRLYLVRLSDGSEVWSYEIGAAITAAPAVTNKVVVVGADDGGVYAFGW